MFPLTMYLYCDYQIIELGTIQTDRLLSCTQMAASICVSLPLHECDYCVIYMAAATYVLIGADASQNRTLCNVLNEIDISAILFAIASVYVTALFQSGNKIVIKNKHVVDVVLI